MSVRRRSVGDGRVVVATARGRNPDLFEKPTAAVVGCHQGRQFRVARGRPRSFREVRDPVVRLVGGDYAEKVRDPGEHEHVSQPHQCSGHDCGAPIRGHGAQPSDPAHLDLVHDVLRGEVVTHAAVQHAAQVLAVSIAVAAGPVQFARHRLARHGHRELLHAAQRDLRGDVVAHDALVDTAECVQRVLGRDHVQFASQPIETCVVVTVAAVVTARHADALYFPEHSVRVRLVNRLDVPQQSGDVEARPRGRRRPSVRCFPGAVLALPVSPPFSGQSLERPNHLVAGGQRGSGRRVHAVISRGHAVTGTGQRHEEQTVEQQGFHDVLPQAGVQPGPRVHANQIADIHAAPVIAELGEPARDLALTVRSELVQIDRRGGGLIGGCAVRPPQFLEIFVKVLRIVTDDHGLKTADRVADREHRVRSRNQ